MSEYKVICGDARTVLADWPAGAVQCVCTSPPYLNLRSYGTHPQVWGGRDDCDHVWGISIPGSARGGSGPNGKNTPQMGYGRDAARGQFCLACGAWRGELGSEPTIEQYVANLVQVFRAVRRVLAPTGILWLNIGDSYSNAGRAGSRGTKRGAGKPRWTDGGALGDKQLLLIPARVALALQADGWILRSDIIWSKPNAMPSSVKDRVSTSYEHVFLFSKQGRYFYDADAIRETYIKPFDNTHRSSYEGPPSGYDIETGTRPTKSDADLPLHPAGRNCRDVWTIATEAFPGSHFAVMPTELARRCILAGSRPGDVIADPFTGSGTTGKVAVSTERDFWGAELNEEYCQMARNRIAAAVPYWQDARRIPPEQDLGPLFNLIPTE